MPDTLEAGEIVHGTGEVVRTPVGPALLGRVVDPLGRPLDDGAPIAAERHDPVERPAPAILDRALVTEPVQTGILVIDSLFPLGRGQRELIIGDRAIGKTAIAVDTIINQKIQRPDLRLRRGRAEVRHRGAGDRRGAPARRAGTLHLRRRSACRRRRDCNGSHRSPA